MQVQRIQNNNYNTNFGARLKIDNQCGKLEKSVVKFLEERFPKETQFSAGNLDVILTANNKECADVITYSNGKSYKDSVLLDLYAEEPKETILEGLLSIFSGLRIRETAQRNIDTLKNEIVEVSDRAFRESTKKFGKVFPVYNCSLTNHDIAPKGSSFPTIIYRDRSNNIVNKE